MNCGNSELYTNFFIDAEFIETEREIDLISLAVINVDGREFYAISTEFDPRHANQFVQDAVLPNLEPPSDAAWQDRRRIKDGLLDFIGDRAPRFWSWGGTPYDWLVMAQFSRWTSVCPMAGNTLPMTCPCWRKWPDSDSSR